MFLKVLLFRVDLAQFKVEGLIVGLFDLRLFELDLFEDTLENLIDRLHILDLLALHVLGEFETVSQQLLCPSTQVIQRIDDVVCVLFKNEG